MTKAELKSIIAISGLTAKDIVEIADEMVKFEAALVDAANAATKTYVGSIIDVKFPSCNKNDWLSDNDDEINRSCNIESCEIKKIVVLDHKEYSTLSNSLLTDNENLFEKIGGSSIDDKYLEGITPGTDAYYSAWGTYGITNVVEVQCENQETFYVNTEGHGYARYVGRRVG